MQEARALVTALEVHFTAFSQKNGLEMSYDRIIHNKNESTIVMTNITFHIKGGSTAQNFFEKQDAYYVRESVEAIVNSLKEEYSIFSFEIGNGRYDNDFCRLNKITLTYKVAGTLEDQYAHLNNEVLREALYNTDEALKPSDRELIKHKKPVGKTYFYNDRLITITNIDLKRPRYCVIYKEANRVRYKTTLNFLATLLRKGTEVTE